MSLEREPHVLLHLLQAVVVCVDEVKGQSASQRAASSPWGDPQKPAYMISVHSTGENVFCHNEHAAWNDSGTLPYKLNSFRDQFPPTETSSIKT